MTKILIMAIEEHHVCVWGGQRTKATKLPAFAPKIAHEPTQVPKLIQKAAEKGGGEWRRAIAIMRRNACAALGSEYKYWFIFNW